MAMESTRVITHSDGSRIAYGITIARSIAAERAVVLIHGLASNRSRWAEFVERTSLDARWSLIRVDLRGHGDSMATGEINLERWCEDIAAILDEEHHTQAVIVGHSLGAQVALKFAVQFPHRTSGIVLIDPVLRGALVGRAQWLALLSPLFNLLAKAARALNAIGFRRRMVEPMDLRALDEEARVALRDSGRTAAFVRRYSSPFADLKSLRSATYLADLVELFRTVPVQRTIAAPVLLVLSTGGTFSDPDRVRALVGKWSNPTVVTITAEHWPLTEKPVEIREAIERWIEDLPEGLRSGFAERGNPTVSGAVTYPPSKVNGSSGGRASS